GIIPKAKTAAVVELWTNTDFELWLDNAIVDKKPNPYGFIPFLIYPKILPARPLSFGLPR
ncbi:unnamed protein product, partial [marine sediment metagenome]